MISHIIVAFYRAAIRTISTRVPLSSAVSQNVGLSASMGCRSRIVVVRPDDTECQLGTHTRLRCNLPHVSKNSLNVCSFRTVAASTATGRS